MEADSYKMNFIATFYTHASALLTDRALKGVGVSSRLCPVPRALSSSCGTCVKYSADDAMLSVMDRDVESVYEITKEGYRLLSHNE